MKTRIISEGAARIEVPLPGDISDVPVSSGGVFYNPEMELNRDITVCAIAGYIRQGELDAGAITYADVMSATGIRGIRMAGELGLSCRLNDWNVEAFELMQKNINLNGLEHLCTPSHRNANTLMHSENFDIIDLDPFGSPAPYLDASARSAHKMLCITATDTAPLCGAHLKSGIRKYAAVPLNTEYHREMGARVLLGAEVRALALRDKGVEVLLTHATRHYVRTYLEIIRGVPAADKAMEGMGYIAHCFSCGFRSWEYGLAPGLDTVCPHCGKPQKLAGPLWLGNIQEPEFCDAVLGELESRRPGKYEQAMKIIGFCRDEIDIPTYYDQHWLSKKLRVSPGPIGELVSRLKDAGVRASRTHFSGTGFKTDADITLINEMLRV